MQTSGAQSEARYAGVDAQHVDHGTVNIAARDDASIAAKARTRASWNDVQLAAGQG
ncbi:hypothetical protein [Bradyrhizobium acaciae]|uniref:hypothetical protein n=1 Tax=Bradyrhizobium acaciae TaxID=2683706 RepID=UPI001E47E8A6|nr:hypothetical protein [Bradyrhizobium acaciae]MCC8982632.1 hypothetical protein [Bradyrhizobium acaciae]